MQRVGKSENIRQKGSSLKLLGVEVAQVDFETLLGPAGLIEAASALPWIGGLESVETCEHLLLRLHHQVPQTLLLLSHQAERACGGVSVLERREDLLVVVVFGKVEPGGLEVAGAGGRLLLKLFDFLHLPAVLELF